MSRPSPAENQKFLGDPTLACCLVMDIQSAFAFAVTSLTDLPKNPAASSGGIPRRRTSRRKNRSAGHHGSWSCM